MHVLCINICFFNGNDPKFEEPILVRQLTSFMRQHSTGSNCKLKRGWDAWYAFFDWAPERVYDQPITLTRPPKRPTIESLVVAAVPLFEMKNIDDVKKLVELVGRLTCPQETEPV